MLSSGGRHTTYWRDWSSEVSSYDLARADFGFTDPNDSPPNALLAVEITTLPGAGVLKDNGVAVTAGQFVTATDISRGRKSVVEGKRVDRGGRRIFKKQKSAIKDCAH